LETTIEISKYPLDKNYEAPILDFIQRLNANKELTVKTNATSTHITGEYFTVMNILTQEIKTSYDKYGKVIFVVKILSGRLEI
jgi:uncharacterized protein YqgV (UPF0045/DUF77 family)